MATISSTLYTSTPPTTHYSFTRTKAALDSLNVRPPSIEGTCLHVWATRTLPQVTWNTPRSIGKYKCTSVQTTDSIYPPHHRPFPICHSPKGRCRSLKLLPLVLFSYVDNNKHKLTVARVSLPTQSSPRHQQHAQSLANCLSLRCAASLVSDDAHFCILRASYLHLGLIAGSACSAKWVYVQIYCWVYCAEHTSGRIKYAK